MRPVLKIPNYKMSKVATKILKEKNTLRKYKLQAYPWDQL